MRKISTDNSINSGLEEGNRLIIDSDSLEAFVEKTYGSFLTSKTWGSYEKVFAVFYFIFIDVNWVCRSEDNVY